MKAADGGHDYRSITDENIDENIDENGDKPANGEKITAEVACEETDL